MGTGEKPMNLLRFPARRPVRSPLAGHLEAVEALLEECRRRQTSMRDEGRRLRGALRRLRVQMGHLALGQSRLGRSLGRLRAVQARMRRPLAGV